MPRVKKSDVVQITPELKQFAEESQAKVDNDYAEYLAKKKIKIPKTNPTESELKPVQVFGEVKKVRVKKTAKKMVDSSGSDNSNEGETTTVTEKKNNKWLEHIRTYRQENPAVSYKEALKLAKESYSR